MTRTQIVRSIAAVVAGFVAVVVLANGSDMILAAAAGLQPFAEEQEDGGLPWWVLAVVFVYRPFVTVVGGYLTAWLAPSRPLRHAVVLGVLGVLLSIYGAVSSWGLTPAWFTVALVVLVLPGTALGGWLRARSGSSATTLASRPDSEPPGVTRP